MERRRGGGAAAGRRAAVPAHELGLAALGQRDLDRVEVAWDLGGGEDVARLVADLSAGVARGEVRQREQADLGVGGDLGRLARGAVQGLGGALGVLVQERRLVDEQVGAVCGDDDRVGRRRVAADDDAPPGARLAR